MSMKNEMCKTCRYFEYVLGSNKDGECRAQPPVLKDDGAYGSWPLVKDFNWCGCYKSNRGLCKLLDYNKKRGQSNGKHIM